MAKVFKIAPTTQKYDWGKIGTSSKVAQFASASQLAGFTIDERSPYAEVRGRDCWGDNQMGLTFVSGCGVVDGDSPYVTFARQVFE